MISVHFYNKRIKLISFYKLHFMNMFEIIEHFDSANIQYSLKFNS